MTDVSLLRQIAAEFKGLSQEGNLFAPGYWKKAQCVTDAADEIERLREIEAIHADKQSLFNSYCDRMTEIVGGLREAAPA
jgi:hypothetical protein